MADEALMRLAERVEALSGLDSDIDGELALSQGWRTSYEWWHSPERGFWEGRPPKYTASLDAAMTLVPEGWRLASMFEDAAGDGFKVALCEREGRFGSPAINAAGATFAIALTAAALRARARKSLGDRNG